MAGPIKGTNRLEYERLVEALTTRGMVHPEALRQILTECATRGSLFTEALVNEGTVSDWDLSRVVAEVFGLPFLPVDAYDPAKEALHGLDPGYLLRHCVVPLDRFGKLLTVAMPAMVPSDVLAHIGAQGDAQVVPVVGTVQSNRAWLTANLLPKQQAPPANAAAGAPIADGDWLNLFDAAEEKLRSGPPVDLKSAKPKPPERPAGSGARQDAA